MTGWQIAFETSARQGSVALLRQDVTIKEIVLPATSQTAQTLAPAVADLMLPLEQQRQQLSFVSVALGPGSFTGLRIGVTAAKTLAFALKIPLVSCDSLQAIIAQCRHVSSEFSQYDAVINAYRGQVYWRREDQHGVVLRPSQAIDQANWQQELSHLSAPLLAAGEPWGKSLAIPQGVQLATPSLWSAKAITVGQLAWPQFQKGLVQDPFSVMPNYLRESAAVEKKQQESSL